MTKSIAKTKLLLGTLVLAMAGMWTSCDHDFDRRLLDRDYTDTTSANGKTPKVLYIVAHGARGLSVRDAKPPHLLSLTQNAIYCWNGVSDAQTLNVTTWADLLTGVHKDKHAVTSTALDSSNLVTYPAFFARVKEHSPDIRIASFVASDTLSDYMITGADVNKGFAGDDEGVKTAIINELKVDTAGIVFGEFSGIGAAGDQFGYDVSIPEYKAAILQFDGYIGEIMSALEKRPNFSQEAWLVIVTSDHGGPYAIPPGEDDHTILSNPEMNTFTIFYTPRYQQLFVDKPYTGTRFSGSGVRLYGQDAGAVNAIIPSRNEDFDFGSDVDFTIEFKVKVMPGDQGNYHYRYPAILSKRASFTSGTVGWCFFLEQDYWQINFGQAGLGNVQVRGAAISNGTWHDVAAVIVSRSDGRFARTYTDGVFYAEVNITGMGNISSPAPLTLGFIPGSITDGPADVYISDLRMWKTALDDATIAQFACVTALPDDHPDNDFLLGYWPCLEGQGTHFIDHSTLQHDFDIKGGYAWDNFNELVCPPASSDLASLVIQPVDIPRQILNWMQIPQDTKWDLDGNIWTTTYTNY